jgi:hypothetical protein
MGGVIHGLPELQVKFKEGKALEANEEENVATGYYPTFIGFKWPHPTFACLFLQLSASAQITAHPQVSNAQLPAAC